MKKIKLLIVEDEAAIRDMLRFSLPDTEFSLQDAEDTQKATRLLADEIPDLILLDWMLPGQSGIEFMKWLKQQEHLQDIPIIMLTAKAEEENKVKGLLSGADDYVTKPFSPSELIARIKVVLRRGPLISPEDEIQVRNLIVNTAQNTAKLNGETLKLSPNEFKVLTFFMKHPNKTYSRDQLITRVWGTTVYIDERTVDVQIRRLRDKLKQHAHHTLIKTIRGSGYLFSESEG